MDKQYNPSWNVIVGKNFGSNIVTMTKSYMFASIHNDEIEAGTFAILAAATKGIISIRGVIPDYMDLVLEKLREMKC